uniref:Uncharacterized protein n=1 Tax=Parascaris equorum TaxID=6256 RepID=A0A914RDG5_PAREQ
MVEKGKTGKGEKVLSQKSVLKNNVDCSEISTVLRSIHSSALIHYDLFNDTGKDGIVNVSLSEHFYSGEPIWLSNERAQEGRRSASMFWPAGDAHWPQIPHKPTVVNVFRSWHGYKNRSEWIEDFDEIMELFTRYDDPVNFVAWYLFI